MTNQLNHRSTKFPTSWWLTRKVIGMADMIDISGTTRYEAVKNSAGVDVGIVVSCLGTGWQVAVIETDRRFECFQLEVFDQAGVLVDTKINVRLPDLVACMREALASGQIGAF